MDWAKATTTRRESFVWFGAAYVSDFTVQPRFFQTHHQLENDALHYSSSATNGKKHRFYHYISTISNMHQDSLTSNYTSDIGYFEWSY